MPSGLRRSSVMPFLLRLVTFHHSGTPSLCGASRRSASPTPGISTFSTSAPRSPSKRRRERAGDDGRDVEYPQSGQGTGRSRRGGSGRGRCHPASLAAASGHAIWSHPINQNCQNRISWDPMDIKQLRTFIDVAANGSYARSAAITGSAQSALSRQISALERGIGGRLFHRTGRGVVLTELGERMLPRARALVADAAAWIDAARGERADPHGEVTLGVVPVASRGLIAVARRRTARSAPGIRLRALEAYSGQVEEWLASGRVEIAIYNRYRRGRVANSEVLARTDVHLIARRDHPMARRRELAVRALAEIPLALPVRPNSLTSVLTGPGGLAAFRTRHPLRGRLHATDPGRAARLRPRHHLAARGVFTRDRGRRTGRHSDHAAEDPADHLDVAGFAPSAVRCGANRGAADPPIGGAAAHGPPGGGVTARSCLVRRPAVNRRCEPACRPSAERRCWRAAREQRRRTRQRPRRTSGRPA